jgi:hypothetical protein
MADLLRPCVVPVVAGGDAESELSVPHRWCRNLLLYCWALLAIGAAIGAWTLATPLMAAPDEPAQAIDAAAVVRGQFDVREHTAYLGPEETVQVAEWVASTPSLPVCFGFVPKAPADCAPKLKAGTEIVNAQTQFSHYPPLYYLIVGTPSLLARGAPALYAMRMLGTLVNSSLIALGLFLVSRYHPRRRLFAGVLVGLSPMVFFVSSVLNSSGMEIAAGFAAWCGGLCVIERRPVPSALGGWTALAFAVLVLSRPASPANAAIIVLTLGILAGWARCKELARDRGTLSIRLSILGAVIVACVQVAIGGFPPVLGAPVKPRLSLWESVWLTLRQTEDRLRQAVGNFGFLNVPVPEALFAVWSTAGAFLVVAGLYVSSRCRRALPVLALGIVVLPIILESPKVDTVGLYWQGRYWLPLLVGIPLVAASQLRARTRTSERTIALGIICLGLVLAGAQVWAFIVALHRYEYGLGARRGTIAGWAPPGGVPFVIGLFVLGMVLFLGFIAFAATPVTSAPAAPESRHIGRSVSTTTQSR